MSILNRGHARHGVVVPKIAMVSGRYYGYRSFYGGTATTNAISANVHSANPFIVPKSGTFDRIAVNVTATGTATLMRLGVYSATAAGIPDALLLDSGALDPSGTGIKEATISLALVAGNLYYFTLVANGSLTVTAITTNAAAFGNADASDTAGRSHLTSTHAYAALPATYGAITSYGQLCPHIVMRAV